MKSRKINKAKKYCGGCGNNGSCDYCRSSRTYSNEHRAPVLTAREQLDELEAVEYRLEEGRL